CCPFAPAYFGRSAIRSQQACDGVPKQRLDTRRANLNPTAVPYHRRTSPRLATRLVFKQETQAHRLNDSFLVAILPITLDLDQLAAD
ncbi:hypothetical protein, partial [Cupriavidus basilensis]|uniref:hypothetical protein n=1 Tax=Cupriavidus basilensis TaxID=68895 RepID=UPI0023E861C2